MVSNVSSFIGAGFKGADFFKAKIIRAASNKCKESLSLEKANHIETLGTHRGEQVKGNV